MGGDHAPGITVAGAVAAVRERDDIRVILTGPAARIEAELSGHEYPADRIRVVDAQEMIEMAEHPVEAIRKKRNSSMVVALQLVKNGEADAFISSGNTGAVLVGGMSIIGKADRNLHRPALAPLIPTLKGASLLIDCGANVDARAEHLLQFAKMGSLYMEKIVGKKRPTVGIVNIGAESEKGNSLVKETFPLLSACEDIHFVGSVEARDIPNGDVDVLVCEAFVGNVILKLYEGTGKALVTKMKSGLRSNLRSKIGGLLVKPALRAVFKDFDSGEYGGAPLLGLKKLVVKTHGSASARDITMALKQCVTFCQCNLDEVIGRAVAKKPDQK